MPTICIYKTINGRRCRSEINTPHDEEYCLFHSHNKGIDSEEFYHHIKEKKGKNDYDYEGYVFPPGFTDQFSSHTFNDFANFQAAQFIIEGNYVEISFESAQLLVGSSFRDAKFIINSAACTIDFTNAKFGTTTDFSNITIERVAKYSNVGIDFTGTSFREGVSFEGANIQATEIIFHRASFSGNHTNWDNVTIQAGSLLFDEAAFNSLETTFDNTNLTCSHKINFTNVSFGFHTTNNSNSRLTISEDTVFQAPEINFTDARFYHQDTFIHGHFYGQKVLFEKITAHSLSITFNNAVFSNEKSSNNDGEISFKDAVFAGSETNFLKTKFQSGIISFLRAKFSGAANFVHTQFEGYSIFFADAQFSGKANFGLGSSAEHTTFQAEETIDFRNIEVIGGDAIFDYADFAAKHITFRGAQFSGITDFTQSVFYGSVDFDNVSFEGERIDFKGALFAPIEENMPATNESSTITAKPSNRVSFRRSIFANGSLSFTHAQFQCDKIDFERTQFLGGSLYFNHASFQGHLLLFEETVFHHDVLFTDTTIGINITFENIVIASTSVLRFIALTTPLVNTESAQKSIYRVSFINARFNPFATYFESIRPLNEKNKPHDWEGLYLLFRNCHLKDVYFNNNDLGYFSFYSSTLDLARFISSNWYGREELYLSFFTCKYLGYERRNILLDELLLSEDIEKQESMFFRFNNKHKVTFDEVAALYRQMKSALDSTKDFQNAGWFYFNELEMRRKDLLQRPNRRDHFQARLYELYKFFFGYGEKPLRSFLWLCFFVGFFTILNLMNGFPVAEGKTVNYGFTLWTSNLEPFHFYTFLHDLSHAFIFTLYRILPTNFLPYKLPADTDLSLANQITYLFNSLILIIFLTLTGIGLQRHFKRF